MRVAVQLVLAAPPVRGEEACDICVVDVLDPSGAPRAFAFDEAADCEQWLSRLEVAPPPQRFLLYERSQSTRMWGVEHVGADVVGPYILLSPAQADDDERHRCWARLSGRLKLWKYTPRLLDQVEAQGMHAIAFEKADVRKHRGCRIFQSGCDVQREQFVRVAWTHKIACNFKLPRSGTVPLSVDSAADAARRSCDMRLA